MKRILFICAIVMSIIALVSCDGLGKPFPSNEDENNPTNVTAEGINNDSIASNQNDTIKKAISGKQFTDSIINELQGENNLLTSRIDSLQQRVDTLEEAQSQCVFARLGIWGYIIIILLILILSPISGKMWKVLSRKNPEEEEKIFKDKVRKAIKGDINQIRNEINDNQDINRLKSHLNSIDSKFSDLNRRIDEMSKETYNSFQSIPKEGKTTPDFKHTFYLYAPKNRDRFSDERQPYPEEALYKFTIDPRNPNKATFEFIGRPGTGGMTKALNSRQEIIEFACEAKNAPSENTRTCKPYNGSKGEAVLQNGEWVVTKRQEVVYE